MLSKVLPSQHNDSWLPVHYRENGVELDKGVEHTRARLNLFDNEHHSHLPQRHIARLLEIVSNLKIYPVRRSYRDSVAYAHRSIADHILLCCKIHVLYRRVTPELISTPTYNSEKYVRRFTALSFRTNAYCTVRNLI